MSGLTVHQFICRKDNYGVLLQTGDGLAVAIDAPDAETIEQELQRLGLKLTHILVTHHHNDHTAGIPALKEKYGCHVTGPRAEAMRISNLDREVGERDTFMAGRHDVHVIDTPGHTAGHVTYWLPGDNLAFAGDTLFAMGCGRVLEGNHEMMWNSLSKIARLPLDTVIYCGHEYTLANAKFGLTIEPENEALQQRATEIEACIREGRATLPTRLDLELKTNVFLRPGSEAIRKRLGMGAAADWRVFAEIRERKNRA